MISISSFVMRYSNTRLAQLFKKISCEGSASQIEIYFSPCRQLNNFQTMYLSEDERLLKTAIVLGPIFPSSTSCVFDETFSTVWKKIPARAVPIFTPVS